MERLIEEDKDIGNISRYVKTDNGRGQLIPTSEKNKHRVICRVGYQSGGVWAAKQSEAGLTIDTTPYVLARHDANIEQDDELEWRGKKYTIGVVSRPSLGGGVTCKQAPLVEVR
jgi:SPP1 family predicted phage head-tail adaptor